MYVCVCVCMCVCVFTCSSSGGLLSLGAWPLLSSLSLVLRSLLIKVLKLGIKVCIVVAEIVIPWSLGYVSIPLYSIQRPCSVSCGLLLY
jgi:hypothetical protein